MNWVLVILLNSYSGYSVNSAVFSSKALCESARVEFEKVSTWKDGQVKTYCARSK